MGGDTLALLIVLPLSAIVLGLVGVGAYLLVRDTARRSGGWGINTEQVHCPACGEPAPLVRMAKNWRQVLWGGSTCKKCGVEFDKWGKAIE